MALLSKNLIEYFHRSYFIPEKCVSINTNGLYQAQIHTSTFNSGLEVIGQIFGEDVNKEITKVKGRDKGMNHLAQKAYK
jgi:hypothetical protein